jgi:hypothetical protein
VAIREQFALREEEEAEAIEKRNADLVLV